MIKSNQLKKSLFWIGFALCFNLLIWIVRGEEDALKFLAGYLVEKALSVDNLFVFLLIFSNFSVPEPLTRKVLFWGVFGAIVMRAICIFFGIALIQKFHEITYFFGAFLVFTGFTVFFKKEKKQELEPSRLLSWLKKHLPMTEDFVGDKFFVKDRGKWLATPLLLVLISIETTDLIFAFDSIPAIIGITEDPFLVYTSNILAILGLRALYFLLADMLFLFTYLHLALGFILTFIGAKMLLAKILSIPIPVSLAVIVAAIVVSAICSKKVKDKR